MRECFLFGLLVGTITLSACVPPAPDDRTPNATALSRAAPRITLALAAEYHFTVEFGNEGESLFVRGPCCGANATDMPPQSQFDYRVVRDCKGKFLVLDLPVYVP